MNEQEIAKIVEAVLAHYQSTEKSAVSEETKQCACKSGQDKGNAHTCKCKKHRMTLTAANALIAKVQEKAAEMGLSVVVAVSDASGRPVSVQSMDGAYIASFDIALNKSFTSASLKMSTEKLAGLSQPGESLYGIQFTNGGKIVIFGGGEPLMADDRIVGAIGVSGGSAEQDTYLAAYAKDNFKEVLACL